MADLPNTAQTDNNGNETNAPKPTFAGNGFQPGQPTTPGISRGLVANTSIAFANDNLAHACDFSSDVIKNNSLKSFLVSEANTIREEIRNVMRELGFTDTTGTFQWLKDALQAAQRELSYIQTQILKPIQDFQKIVVQYVQKLQSIITWILGLPAKFAALLQNCLAALYKSVANVFTDASGNSTSTGSTRKI